MNIGGKTKVFAVIGHPVAHSLSPAMHNANFAANGDDAVYVAFDVAPERVVEAVRGLQALGCGGLSVTIPHKEVLFQGLQALEESARQAGAVNTVEFTPGGPKGHNTDGEGFVRAYEEHFGCRFTGRSVCVLGSGGSAKAVAMAARLHDADVMIMARRIEKAREIAGLCAEIPRPGRIEPVDMTQRNTDCRNADIVVNCTPVGMKAGDQTDWRPDHFREGQHFMDLIYVKPETLLMGKAKAGGARVVNGLGMLLHQGAKQYEIWTGRKADLAAMRGALEKSVYGR